ncbi:putative hemolysin [Chitinophaga costaii]|uniref:Putative hemolysin n=1 Tax=Chitinophaga costaii TaxID=1335309 RepID=A0A1C3ZID7_9BACT|nr:hemolysin family protein [Chitinophaga costaii]PUZ30385.1 HlyC/CorC family transporter [Chitinophaga costaii]SCB82098.1 putative hemolysin [Chitinophaga costaii]
MEVVIIIILVLISGLFSMAEIALVSARKLKLEHAANKGDEKAKAALKLANHPDTFLSTVQIGITLVGIFIGLYAGETLKAPLAAWINHHFPAAQPYSNFLAMTVILVVATYISLVLGELVPKRIGLARSENVAKSMARPMTLLSRLAFPFVALLTASTNGILKLFSFKTNETPVTEEEIKAMITEGTHSGAIEETEQEIIERVFYLGDRNITSLMTHRTDVTWLDIKALEADYKSKISESLHSVYPVCDGQIDNIKGVLTIKDLFAAEMGASLQTLMKKPLFVPENNSAYEVLEKFKETQIHAAFIVDEYSTFLGMITLNDILEAIVGDMPQTGQEAEYTLFKREDGSYLVDAQIPFYDFLSEFDRADWMAEFEQEFDTLAGFILYRLEHIPQTGEKLEWRGFTFEIVDMDAHRIDKILVTVGQGAVEEG